MTRSERAAEVARLMALRERAIQELAGVRDVRWVGVGIRDRGGHLADELVFRVYVDRKRPLSEITRERIVPRAVSGVPTDVVEALRSRPNCWAKGTRPVLGGIEVASSPFDEMQNSPGTLGCIVTTGEGKRAILSNYHVLARANSDLRIFQPHYDTCLGFTCNRVGSVLPGFHKHRVHDDGTEYWLDCAVAVLDADIGSRNRLRRVVNNVDAAGPIDVSLPAGTEGIVRVNAQGKVVAIRDGAGELVDTTRIATHAPALPGTIVWKVGNRTGLTAGIVVEILGFCPADFDDQEKRNVLMVKGVAGAESEGKVAFSDEGDSGSVILDLSNRVVGLLVGYCHRKLPDGTEEKVTFASRIEPVVRALGVTINPSPEPVGPAAALVEDAESEDLEPVDLGERLRAVEARVLTTASGRRLLELLHCHAVEAHALVVQRRAVTVVWHRHRGPAFVALLARTLRNPSLPLPRAVDGVPIERLLAAMREALARHGTQALRATLERDGDWLLDLMCGCAHVEDLFSRLDDVAASTEARA